MGLRNVSKLTATVDIRGERIDLRPFTLDEIFGIFGKFPMFAKMLGAPEPEVDPKLSPAELVKTFPNAVAELIAKCADEDTDEGRAAARELSPIDQLTLLENVFVISIGEEGLVPFAARVRALATGRQKKEDVPSTNSSSNFTSAALQLDIPPNVRGPLRLVS